MKNDKIKNSLFLVYSPFQVVCAFEAISAYSIVNPIIYCLGGSYLKRNEKTPHLLDELGLSYQIMDVKSFPWRIIDLVKHRNQFERCYIGDYFDPFLRLVASFLLRKKGELFYLDDGASTLTAINIPHPLRLPKFKTRIQYVLPIVISKLKRHSESFYSIFSTPNGEVNSLNAIKNKYLLNTYSPKGVFIIGTTYHGFNAPETLYQLLKNTFSHFSDNEIYYSPHRSIVKDKTILDICRDYNVKYIVSDYCVEVDYIKKGYNPQMIIGFGSTALFTLKRIYPAARVISVKYPAVMVKGNEKTYDIVNENLKSAGVEILTILP